MSYSSVFVVQNTVEWEQFEWSVATVINGKCEWFKSDTNGKQTVSAFHSCYESWSGFILVVRDWLIHPRVTWMKWEIEWGDLFQEIANNFNKSNILNSERRQNKKCITTDHVYIDALYPCDVSSDDVS